MYTIAVDVMGSDDAPKSELLGIKVALRENPQLKIVAFGVEEAIAPYYFEDERLTYHYTSDAIKGTDDAATAYRTRKDSSMVRAIQYVKDKNADAVVSSGNTGAYIASALFMLGRIKGLQRPALTTIVPTDTKGKQFVFADLGAVVDATPVNLDQSAVLVSEIAKIMLGTPNPKVGLLNIGEEEKKGSTLYVEAHQLLKENPSINFYGNIEPRFIFDGHIDALVADGFSGNIAIKSFEGMQKLISRVLKREIMKGVGTKIGGVLIKPALAGLKETLDYESIGGAVLAGVKAPVIKSHGATSETQFSSAISLGVTFLECRLVENIAMEIAKKEG